MNIIEYIKEQTNNDVLFVYKTGSMLFCKNCKDRDIVVITASGDDYRRILRYEDYDIFCYSLVGIKKCLEFQLNNRCALYLIALELAKGDNIVYGENPMPDFHLLDHKEKLIKLLTCRARTYDCNPIISNKNNKNACLKQSIWLFANYFALVNNSLDFTAEQLDIIQKCHDNELPRSYAEDIYQKLLEIQQTRQFTEDLT